MKKLMTMIAAVGMAFGLYAADENLIIGAAFDSTDAGAKYTWTGASGFNLDYWSAVNAAVADVAKLVTGDSNALNNKRPLAFTPGKHDGYIDIKTTLGNPLEQKLKTNGGEPIGTKGILFDGLVNMTVFDAGVDAVPAADLTGAKIACYLQATDDDETGTNFVVRAANEPAGGWVCSADKALVPGWHRLTIKAIPVTSTQMGFVIFIDGDNTPETGTADAVVCKAAIIQDTTGYSFEAKKWNETGKLFLSMGDDMQISAIAFDGQGSVDELAFTTTFPAWAMGEDGYYVSFDATKLSIVIGGTTYTKSPAEVSGTPGDVTIAWTSTDGSIVNGSTTITVKSGETVELSDYTDDAAASFAGIGYEDVAGAVAAANDDTVDGELKLYTTEGTESVALFGSHLITLNLNGQTIGDVEFGCPAAIVGTGKIDGTFAFNDALTIGADVKFKNDINDALEGTKMIAVKGDDDYYTVKDAVIVTYDLQDKGVDFTDKIVKGTAPTRPAVDPTYEGFDFGGWYNEPECATEFDFSLALSADTTAYANWTAKVTDHSVTITWNPAEVDNPIEKVGYTIGAQGEIIDVENGVAFKVADGVTITVVATTKDWWKAAGTGDYTITADKDDIVITATQINPDSPATPAEAGITSGAFANASKTDVGKVAGWAANNHVTKEVVNGIEFDAAGNPVNDAAEAFLLGCANTEGAIEAAAKQFKFNAIVPGEIPTPGLPEGANGTAVQLGADAVTGPWDAAKASNKFFMSVLRFVATPDAAK